MNADPAYQAVRRPASDHGRKPSNRSWSALGAKYIAKPPHGVDEFALERIVDLGPQPADVDVDDVGVAVEVDVPHLLGDVGPRQRLAGMLGEQRQEHELLRRQVDRLSRARHALPPGLDP